MRSAEVDPRRAGARRRTLLSFATFTWRSRWAEVQRAAEGRVVSMDDAPAWPAALVLGAPAPGLQVGAVLEDRLLTASALFAAGKAGRLILSGTAGEVAVMGSFLAERDVPGSALVLDPRGRHTFESVRNARALGETKLLVVTQRFHLPRALFLAGRLGLEALGVPADRRPYLHQRRFEQREVFSSVLAYWMAREGPTPVVR